MVLSLIVNPMLTLKKIVVFFLRYVFRYDQNAHYNQTVRYKSK